MMPAAGGRARAASAHAVHPRVACVNNRDGAFRGARAVLDPARGDGGALGWCRGRYRGVVRHGRTVVARFSFRVR
jgi:hypothetical protein